MLDYQKIGLFLSKKRKLSKLTQKQLADKLNISFQAVSRWEKGLSIPSVDLLQSLADLFQVTVDEILKGEDNWPIFSYEKSGVDVTKIDLMNNDLKDIIDIYQYNPAFRGAVYYLEDAMPAKSLQIVSKVQEPVTKQILALEYGYIDELIEDIICTLINDILMIGAKPLYITSTLIVGNMNRKFLEKIIKVFNEKTKKYNIKYLTGQSSIKPQALYFHQCLISTTITGILDKELEIDTRQICENDIILAITSNGIHHYGYSLIDSLIKTIPQIKKETINGRNFIDEIMKKQDCYYDALIDLIIKKKVKGLVNISGCGFQRNLMRIIPDGLCASVDLNKIVLPEIYQCLKSFLKVSEDEMLDTFNCGVGYIVIVTPDRKDEVINHINRYFSCIQIGLIKKGTRKIKLNNHLNWNRS
ncbi:MAG TPA: helix-turn-helix domain-containing protein [Candidatus Erysipelatoclostridium merdavium]|uniref:Phosphoribosylformylglycinamidine cyclo-ligase n=1 Tax=Candidatus Erysipelatoclostridium merdavium TaxID=2838566 RepID=A0A9D1XM22_9FIRM|nr:helix-turn-helix domain-containing protein [Candidatus Erysipelatoclostridium merdavium]